MFISLLPLVSSSLPPFAHVVAFMPFCARLRVQPDTLLTSCLAHSPCSRHYWSTELYPRCMPCACAQVGVKRGSVCVCVCECALMVCFLDGYEWMDYTRACTATHTHCHTHTHRHAHMHCHTYALPHTLIAAHTHCRTHDTDMVGMTRRDALTAKPWSARHAPSSELESRLGSQPNRRQLEGQVIAIRSGQVRSVNFSASLR